MTGYGTEKVFQLEVEDRIEEMRHDLLWSQRGFDLFRSFMECHAVLDVADVLHLALIELRKSPSTQTPLAQNLRKFMQAVEKFTEDFEEPWMRPRAEEIVREMYRDAA